MNTAACILAGTASNSGKTTVTLGLLAAVGELGLAVQPFKCGPDFIDPGLHQLVTGTVSRNLDPWMCGHQWTKSSFARQARGAEFSLVEGVMGMFDGGPSSSAALARLLNLPVILVLDVASMAESAAAVVKGFESIDPAVAPRAVLLNRVASRRHLEMVETAIARHCRAEVIGHLPRTAQFAIPSRHLGLLTGDENPISREALKRLSQTVREHVDLRRLLEICRLPLPEPAGPGEPLPVAAHATPCRIGVARDKAFCFYYQDNFDLLEAAGAELVFFSPLSDQELPEGISGLYLGGGYPELHARQLSANEPMRQAIHRWIEADRPLYAECGGFMYLCRGIEVEGNTYPMVGVFPTSARMAGRRAALGYRAVTTRSTSCFGPPGTELRGHEFHYSTIAEMPASIERLFALADGRLEGYRYRQALGGYLHLHFGFSPDVAGAFIGACRASAPTAMPADGS